MLGVKAGRIGLSLLHSPAFTGRKGSALQGGWVQLLKGGWGPALQGGWGSAFEGRVGPALQGGWGSACFIAQLSQGGSVQLYREGGFSF